MAFLQEVFHRFRGHFGTWNETADSGPNCAGMLSDAIEYVVDKTFPRLRAIPGYARRLKSPVATTFRHIDELAEGIPALFPCSQESFHSDPRVRAFFVNPQHMREVFSQSQEVRDLFEAHPHSAECCVLLCVHKEEKQTLGTALVGDTLRREVLQTAVNFVGHRVYAPGIDEADARQALKCCIFNALLAHIKQSGNNAKRRVLDLENRLRMLRSELPESRWSEDTDTRDTPIAMQIREIESSLAQTDLRFLTLEDYLHFACNILNNPGRFISSSVVHLRLDQMSIKVDDPEAPGKDLFVSEILITSQEPRIAALVRFPRSELLPQSEITAKSVLFLHG